MIIYVSVLETHCVTYVYKVEKNETLVIVFN